MSTEQLLIGLGGLILSGLIYFAGVIRGKRYREEDSRQRLREERRRRIEKVRDTYLDLSLSLRDSGPSALVKAGVKSLHDSGEIREVVGWIEQSAGNNPLGGELCDALRDEDLKAFFDEVNFARGTGNFRELLDRYKNRR